METGTYIGTITFSSLALAPHGRAAKAANASFYDVNHAGDGVEGQEGLGAFAFSFGVMQWWRKLLLITPCTQKPHTHTHTRAGKQLVAEVLGNQASTLGLQAAVRASANIARGPEGRFSRLPRVPVVLHMVRWLLVVLCCGGSLCIVSSGR